MTSLKGRVLALFVALIAVSATLHLLVLLHTHGAAYDIHSYMLQAQAVLHHENVYTATRRYPYPPIWLYIPALCLVLSHALGWSFDELVRVPACLGDLGITLFLARFGVARHGWGWHAPIYAALFALNPVPLLISAGHGQFDSIVILLILIACAMNSPLGALAIGVAIALKGYPVVLFPLFWLRSSERIKFTVCATMPLLAAGVVFIAVFGFSWFMIIHIVGYAGVPSIGWLAVDSVPRLLGRVLELGFAAFAVMVAFKMRCDDPYLAVAVTFMGIYALGYDLSVQYLLWVMPFLIVTSFPWSILYSLGSGMSATVFYAVRFPAVLPVSASLFRPPSLAVYQVFVMIPSGIAVVYLIRRRLLLVARREPGQASELC